MILTFKINDIFIRNKKRLNELNIHSKFILVGPDGYQTYARVFYRDRHAPVIHLVIDHLKDKYNS